MNKKHFLIVLVMVAVASASLFGGYQAYRYNRSMMNKSVFSNNIEAKADNLEEGDDFWDKIVDWWNRKDWNRELKNCSGKFLWGTTITTEIDGVPVTIERGISYNVGNGTKWVCYRMEDGKGQLAHCTETICR